MRGIFILLTALVMGQATMAQELSRKGAVLDTTAQGSEPPRFTMPASPSGMPHAQLPGPAPVVSVSNGHQPSFLKDSLLSRGFEEQSPTIAPSKSNGYYNAESMMTVGGWNMVGAGGMASMPGMMDVGSAAIGLSRSLGRLTMNVGVGANRYHANIMDNPVLSAQGIRSMSTQYGVGGSLSLRLNADWSVTAYGRYYARNPYFFMAAFPYVHTSVYGAYATYSSGWFGVDMGARRYYDAFGRRWITEPIVTPKFKLWNKVWLELPVGGLVRQGLENVVHPRRKGPMMMPAPRK